MLPFFQGFGIGAGLIIAIGAQNSFVLTQGIKRQYFFLIPSICVLCDILLISLGAAGVGTYVAANAHISRLAAMGGAIFLFWYGLRSLYSVFTTDKQKIDSSQNCGLRSIISSTLAITFLNPHIYLDTIVLLGSISGQFSGFSRLIFVFGACLASTIWFFSLSFFGTVLQPVFRNPASWKILDLSICCIMWSIGYSIWPK